MAEMLRDKDSTQRHLSAARRHQRRARRIKGASVFADRMEPFRADLLAAKKATEEAIEGEEDALDEFLLRDDELDDAVKTAFERAGQFDRDNPGQRMQEILYPEGGFTPITGAHREREEPDLVDNLASRYDDLPENHELRPTGGELRKKASDSREGARLWRQAEKKRKDTEGDEETDSAALRRQYEANYLDARRLLGRKAAERLFVAVRRSSSASAKAPTALASGALTAPPRIRGESGGVLRPACPNAAYAQPLPRDRDRFSDFANPTRNPNV